MNKRHYDICPMWVNLQGGRHYKPSQTSFFGSVQTIRFGTIRLFSRKGPNTASHGEVNSVSSSRNISFDNDGAMPQAKSYATFV